MGARRGSLALPLKPVLLKPTDMVYSRSGNKLDFDREPALWL
ncbi:MAG: hypothetical protein [Olavius algarvensis Delta 4 endosymbiont]|nr:MAG: hypothetical protein [Olavius algarvensis Delta 4 endosymbiont]